MRKLMICLILVAMTSLACQVFLSNEAEQNEENLDERTGEAVIKELEVQDALPPEHLQQDAPVKK